MMDDWQDIPAANSTPSASADDWQDVGSSELPKEKGVNASNNDAKSSRPDKNVQQGLSPLVQHPVYQDISDTDSFGQIAGKQALNQAMSALPYFVDKDPSLSTGQRVSDMVKSGVTGAGQAIAGAVPFAVDTAHNVGEWAGNKLGQAYTGVETQPQYTNYTGDVLRGLNLDYEPQTAAGQRAQLLGSVAGPGLALKAARAPAVKDFVGSEDSTAGNAAKFNLDQQARPTDAQLRDVAGRAYDRADELGGMYTPDETNRWISSVSKHMPQSPEGRLLQGDTPVTKYNEKLQDLRGRPLSYQALDDIDKHLTRMVEGERKIDGTLTPEGQQWVDVQSNLRSVANDPGVIGAEGNEGFAARKQAQGLWAQQARLNEVQRAFNRGNSREIPITGIRNEFRSIQQNPRRFNLYTPDEQKLIDQLASSSTTADAVRTAGSRLINYLAIGHGNPTGVVASHVVTRAARDFGSRLKEGMLNDLQDQILSRQEMPVLDRPYQYDKETVYGRPELEPPPIYGNPPPRAPTPSGPAPQALLARGDMDPFYTPQGRALSFQPRPDWEVSPEGFVRKPSDVAAPAPRPAEGAIMRRAGENASDRNVKRLMITHQPRPDFVGTDVGITQPPSNVLGALLGEDQGLPIDQGELNSIRTNPRWPPENNRGGAVNMARGGVVRKKINNYPALEKRA